MSAIRRVPLVLALLLLGAGCQNDAPSRGTPPDAGLGDLGFLPDGGGPVVVDGSFLAVIVTPDTIEEQIHNDVTVSVHIFSSRGFRVPGIPVRFDIEGDNPGHGEVSIQEVVTDEAGKAQSQLSVGSEPGEYTLVVSAPAAEPVRVPVAVRPRPTGRLEVSVESVGPGRLIRSEVYVMPGTNRCPYNPVVIPFGELVKATVSGVGETTSFDGHRFVADEPLTLWARGMVGSNTMSTWAAAGCQENVVVPANGTASLTLSMVQRPLNCVGTFDVTGQYDFTDAIPGTAGEVIRRLDDLFNNTARFLIDGIQDLLEAFLGGIIATVINWVVDQIQPMVEDWINQWILDIAPDWLLDFFQIGRDLLQIVNNLEMLSVIRFDKTGSDFQVAGTEEWVGIALYWRLNCDADDPPDCGRHEFNMEDLLQVEQPLEAVFATFNARVNNFNRLRMDPHDVNLQYGRLILFVLNELILPAVADGAHSLTEAVINVLDCESLAWSVCGDDGEWGGEYLGVRVGFDVDDVIDWCEGAAGFLGDTVEDILGDLGFDSVLTIEGSCDLYEDDFDLIVDRLESGSYRGWFNVDGLQGDPFTGEFRGDRRQ